MIQKEIKENPQNGGKSVQKDERGRFVKGHTKLGGNKIGDISLAVQMKRKLKEVSKEGKENLVEFINIIWDMAVNEKNEAMIRLIWNYVDGMPKQAIDIGPTEGLKELTDFFREMAKVKKDDEG